MMNTIKRCFLFLIPLLFVFSTMAMAAPVTTVIAEAVGTTFMKAQEAAALPYLEKQTPRGEAALSYEGHTISSVQELSDGNTGQLLAYVFSLQPKGFVVVSPDTTITPVIAYSFEGDFNWEDSENNALLNILKYDMQQRVMAIFLLPEDLRESNRNLWDKYFFEDAGFMSDLTESAVYGPQLSTAWHQSSPYNNYCPVDPNTDSRSVVGCVATAMAQIVNYHACTSSVTFGSADNYTTDTRKISVDASTATMSGITYPASDTTAARLSYACGVSVQMDYTSSSSGAMTSAVASALKNKFGFTQATAYAPQSGYGVPVLSTFYSKLQDNMKHSKPAQLAIQSDSGGHSIVCDGYNSSTGQYHLNYGWGSSSPSPPWWYTLPTGMPAGYSIVKYGVLDITSSCHPSCPDLYSWNGNSYDLAGPIFIQTHSPLSERHQERRIAAPVRPMEDTLAFMIKEIDGEESYINSAAILCSFKWAPADKEWTPLTLISATHSTLGDVVEALRAQDESRVHMVPGDEIMLRYAIPFPEAGHSLFEPGLFELEFLGWSSGYYLWRDDIWCEAWSLFPEVRLEPGAVAIFEGMVNNMTTEALPEDAEVWFVLDDRAKTRIGPVSVSGLPGATPTSFSFQWKVPQDFTPSVYAYAPRVYVGNKDITWDIPITSMGHQDIRSMHADRINESGCSNN